MDLDKLLQENQELKRQISGWVLQGHIHSLASLFAFNPDALLTSASCKQSSLETSCVMFQSC